MEQHKIPQASIKPLLVGLVLAAPVWALIFLAVRHFL